MLGLSVIATQRHFHLFPIDESFGSVENQYNQNKGKNSFDAGMPTDNSNVLLISTSFLKGGMRSCGRCFCYSVYCSLAMQRVNDTIV